MDASLESGEPQRTFVELVYLRTQLLYPVVLLFAFILSAGVHSIVTSQSKEEIVVPTVKGPGGKPLPVTKRKREQLDEPQVLDPVADSSFARTIFRYGTAALIVTFLANGAAIAVHALQSSGGADAGLGWWCGEERTVSNPPSLPVHKPKGLPHGTLYHAKCHMLTRAPQGLRCRLGISIRLCSDHAL